MHQRGEQAWIKPYSGVIGVSVATVVYYGFLIRLMLVKIGLHREYRERGRFDGTSHATADCSRPIAHSSTCWSTSPPS